MGVHTGQGMAALLIVDVQAGFINEHTQHVIPKIEELQSSYDLVYVTRFLNVPGSPYRRFMGWTRFGEGTADTGLAFSPESKAIILDKTGYSCVTPKFVDGLLEQQVREVHICGIDTDACVLKCAVDLFEYGIRPVVLSQVVASTAGDSYHQSGLHVLSRLIGREQIW